MDIIRVKPTGGLCNYLRVALSYLQKARSERKQLEVIWEVTPACNGFFEDIFLPLPGMVVKKWTTKKLDYEGCYACGDFSSCASELRLQEKLRRRAIELIEQLGGDFYAVHLRRTDLGASTEFDREIYQFIKEADRPVYLATDNRVTQDELLGGDEVGRVVVNKKISSGASGLRHTSLSDAAVDLFVCASANYFKGTPGSSFSEFIMVLAPRVRYALLA